MMTRHHTNAPQTSLWAGKPSQSARMALTTIENGLMLANQRRADGIEATGTNAEEMNVSGNTAMNPTELAASGEDTSSPRKAKIHENAYPNSSNRTIPRTTCPALAWKEKPMISPVTSRMGIDRALVAMSANVRPASTAARAMGSERKRSMRPL